MEAKNLENKFKLTKSGEIRTRFAPSPTGNLHIGSARTAFFNYLFSKKYEGRFILRIEDTDTERSSINFEKDIIESLKWLNIEWDEGPIEIVEDNEPGKQNKERNGKYIGDYGPYRQSERKDIYKKYLEKLLSEDKAYYCFCSSEELEAKRQYQMSIGKPALYDGKCSKLSKKEVEENIKNGKQFVIRLRTPVLIVKFKDLVRGEVEFNSELIGDFVIAKGFDSALYNFTAAVDDFEMRITHIIRGEDHLSNTPKQILIQKALGFDNPEYAHLPLILAPDKSKLSKRHGAVSVNEYKESGYLPEAIINFLAFLGWNPGTERDIYSLPSLVKEFSFEKVQKSGAIFNIKKLDFLNGFYIRKKSIEKLTALCLPYLIGAELIIPVFETEQYPPAYGGFLTSQKYKIIETNAEIKFEELKKIISIYQERLKKLSEITDLTSFFFKDKLSYDRELLRWKDMSDKEIHSSLDVLIDLLSFVEEEDWQKENLEKVLSPENLTKLSKGGQTGDRGRILWPLRVSLTGEKFSAGPFEIAAILGKQKTLERIKNAKALISD
jgi:glutamyl-tRNA synthetase